MTQQAQALAACRAGDFAAALAGFEALLADALVLLRALRARHLAQPLGIAWDGVETLDAK